MVGHLRGQVREADDRDALAHDLVPGLRELAVAARLGGEVDDAAPGRMFATAEAGISFGAGRPGMSAVVITTSKSGTRSSSAACCWACCSGVSSLA